MNDYLSLEECVDYLHDNHIISEVCFANLKAELYELYESMSAMQEMIDEEGYNKHDNTNNCGTSKEE